MFPGLEFGLFERLQGVIYTFGGILAPVAWKHPSLDGLLQVQLKAVSYLVNHLRRVGMPFLFSLSPRSLLVLLGLLREKFQLFGDFLEAGFAF